MRLSPEWQVAMEAPFVNDMIHGTMKKYDESGKLVSEIRFENDEEVK